MDDNISIISLLSKVIDDEKQIKILQLISEGYHGDKLLEKLLGLMEE